MEFYLSQVPWSVIAGFHTGWGGREECPVVRSGITGVV